MARKPGKKPRRKSAKNGTVKFGPLDHWVGFNLRMAQESAFAAFSHQSREIGESPGRFAILTLIGENPGISQSALGDAAGRDKSSMTPVLEGLVRRGLVQRMRADSDKRSYRLSLTPSGEDTRERMARCARRHEKNLDRILGKDRTRFMRVLKRLAANLD
jgi:DNA-binding MarR family transcriptional regulator